MDAINVNVDQKGLGKLWGEWLVKHVPEGGKVLEVRGVAGTSVDTDRHDGIHEVFAYASGNPYTLFSIAAVVLGGVSLFGGTGSVVGAIFGAFAFRTIGDLLFVFDFDPLWQPLFQGVVLLLAVSLGAFGLFRVRNRLDWFA